MLNAFANLGVCVRQAIMGMKKQLLHLKNLKHLY